MTEIEALGQSCWDQFVAIVDAVLKDDWSDALASRTDALALDWMLLHQANPRYATTLARRLLRRGNPRTGDGLPVSLASAGVIGHMCRKGTLPTLLGVIG